MTEQQKFWIDNASFEQLLAKVRFEPVNSQWFSNDTGIYLMERYYKAKSQTSPTEVVRISKKLGWR